ncbi:SDR family oxidoreductase [Candidatus Mycobacterium methanotrophicum]|uniref:dTDP-4-dehydrorhamnose reductase n=1 Tax=Candidatus Mycobacterium methanotrophicum TaxID=2943498 RepID=A0ABY4QS76_9MYCO|nr:sugar nucleotide-binding protein [Candidatus Mycobacterium methanotrophicum]UQX13192.1 sugar nucleotide-binding protein [Candidatus Mycobacterium methanotrophicum]
MTVHVLVLGAGGRVGAALCDLLPGYGFSVHGLTRSEVDVGDDDAVAACIAAADPGVVIYAVAIADPDRCERDPAASYEANVAGVQRVAAVAARTGRRVIYYSSDYVFGSAGTYFEDAAVAPLQVYGRHKAEAEQLVLGCGCNVVLRLPLLFGSKDFVADAVRAALAGAPLAVDRRRRFPIPVTHVARLTAGIITSEAVSGIYHAVGVEAVTKAEWAAQIAGLLGRPVPPAVAPGGGLGAPRPVDVELATRHPQLRTVPGTLWAATRARVAELAKPV